MGKNHKKSINYGDIIGLLLVGISVFTAFGLVSFAQGNGGTTGSSAIVTEICLVFNGIKNVIFILGLTLMIIGGAVYAGANLMPSQNRGAFQGYGMAMIIGGIIGVAIAVAAPFILNLIVNVSPNANTFQSGTTGTTTGLTATGAGSSLC